MRNAIRSIPAVVFVAMACGALALMLNGFGSSISERNGRIDRVRKANQSELASTLCPDYFKGELSRLEANQLSWCEDFRGGAKMAAQPVASDETYARWLGQVKD
ncbi:hypothetical protein FY136_28745 (plasmid) [Agrobacterium tumefaciens]|uniref:hypothetical protein n=1 Tax=Agrobacterium tumefaciens TaxID=358 RepID=UPI0021D27276|nr:hypothetical protein [Agrobacterium tumefaciens]UXT53252.1 hypothetical protein FY136_28745 [Agrobacterium tumefaciens]